MKYAVITGAAGGIGRALVQQFSAAGYAVIAADRMPAPGGLACSLYLQADVERTVQDEAYAHATFERIREHIGGTHLHALVNNAAVQVLGGVASLSRDDWHRTLDTNLLAPFVWAQALLPQLEAAHGCVVNVSSIHARLTKSGFVAYATSKAALSGMTRAMAVDLGGRVRVNAIEPAAIETPMLAAGFAGRPEAFSALEAAHPIGRLGRPDEVAALAVALCDTRFTFLTGGCVSVDGGVGSRLHDPA